MSDRCTGDAEKRLGYHYNDLYSAEWQKAQRIMMSTQDRDHGPVPAVGQLDHVQGHADARVTLIEYGDYACHQSGEAHAAVEEIREQAGNGLRFVFRHFALSGAHPESAHAAEAAE